MLTKYEIEENTDLDVGKITIVDGPTISANIVTPISYSELQHRIDMNMDITTSIPF